MPPAPPASGFIFTVDPSLASFAVPVNDYLISDSQYDAIATGAIIFSSDAPSDDEPADPSKETQSYPTKVLLLQRASHDSRPLHWEVPGGAVDADDKSILHGLAREVWEEAGLLVKHVVRQVGQGQAFTSSKGLRVIKYTFEVDADDGSKGLPIVATDPAEHADFVWVTDEELREQEVAPRQPDITGKSFIELKITSPDQKRVILEGFGLHKGLKPSLDKALGSVAWE